MAEKLRLLVVEDSDDDAALLQRKLREGGFEIESLQVQTSEAMREALTNREWDLVISDYSMPVFDGISAFATLRESGKDIPFIFVSGTLGEENAVEAMRMGVADYFVKGHLNRLIPAIRRELGMSEDRRRYRRAEAALRLAEKQLRQSQRMEAMGRLAGGVAHDFGNLLTVILGHTSLLVKGMDASHEHWVGLREVHDCSERAAALTRQLLQFGSNEAARRVRVDLNAAIRGTESLLRRLGGSKVDIDFQVPDEASWIFADPDHLGRILTNLVVNARDAMRGQGKLRIGSSVSDLSEQDVAAIPQLRPGPHALLTVQDNGTGMSDETLAHVFEPFFTTKESGKGTGLGLAIVFGAVQQNEGHIRVQSKPGEGSVFSMLFPQVDGPDRPENSVIVSPRQPRRGVETILVAEDDEVLRDYMRLALARREFHVLAAAGGEQALELGRLHPGTIHLLIVDLKLGHGMDGQELARRLIAEKRADTRVLFMTGYAEPRLLDDLVEGGSRLLLKPFGVEELVTAVRDILDRPGLPGQRAR